MKKNPPSPQPASLKSKLLAAVPLLFIMAMAAFVVLLHIKEEFAGGKVSSDLFVFLNLAQRISEGAGFVYNHPFTHNLWQHGLQLTPIAPGRIMHPLLISFCELFTKDFLLAAVFVSAFSHLLIAMFVYFLARAWYSTKVAVFAAILFILNRWAVGYTIWGQSDTPFVVFLTAAFWVVYAAKNWKHYLAGGLLFGLANITRPIGPTYLPPLLIFLLLKDYKNPKKALSNIALFVAAALVPKMSIKAIDIFYFGHAQLHKNAKGITAARLLFYTKFFPKLTSIRHLEFPQSIYSMIMFNPLIRASFITKVLANLSAVPNTINAFIFDNLWVGRASLLGLLWIERDKKRNFMKLAILAMLVSQILILSMTVYKYRYFYPILPFGCILAAAFLVRFTDFVIRFKGKLKFLQAIIFIPALYFMLFPVPVFHTYEPWPRRFTRKLHKRPKSNAMLLQYCEKLDELIPDGMPYLCDFFGHVSDTYMKTRHVVGLYPRTLTMLEKLHLEKTDVDAILLTPSYIIPDREFMEWMNIFIYPESFLGFKPHEVKVGTFRTVLYLRNAQQELLKISEKLNNTDQLNEKLMLAGLARTIRPRNQKLADRLESLRVQGTKQAEKLIKQAKATTDPQTAFSLLKQAGASSNGIGLSTIGKTAKDLKTVKHIYKDRFTHNPDYEVRPEIAGIPAPPTLTDGLITERFPVIGLDTNFDFDLKTTRYVDEVVVKTDFDPESEYFDTIEVYTSIDGFNWEPAAKLNATPTQKGLHRLSIKNIDRFCRKIRIKITGDGIRFIKVRELEVWGYTNIKPVTHVKLLPDFEPKGPLFAHISPRQTGNVIAYKNNERPNVLAKAGQDKKGIMLFGNYIFLFPGSYVCTTKIQAEKSSNPDLPVITVDVAADRGRTILATKTLNFSDLPAPGPDGFIDIKLPFQHLKTGKVEPRVYFHANADITCRYITIDGKIRLPALANTENGKIENTFIESE